MAAGTAGALTNAEWGFDDSDTDMITLAATSVGHLEGDIGMSVPREIAWLTMAGLNLDHYVVSKDVRISAVAQEILQANLQYAWDNPAAVTGVLTIDEDDGDTVALICNTNAPNSGSRAISVPKALSVGDGAYGITKASAGGDNVQTLALEFGAEADASSSGLLFTLTDTYT